MVVEGGVLNQIDIFFIESKCPQDQKSRKKEDYLEKRERKIRNKNKNRNRNKQKLVQDKLLKLKLKNGIKIFKKRLKIEEEFCKELNITEMNLGMMLL